MIVQVKSVSIPSMYTLGYGWGYEYDLESEAPTTRQVKFAGDHRMMRLIAEELDHDDEAPLAEVEPYQVIQVVDERPPGSGKEER